MEACFRIFGKWGRGVNPPWHGGMFSDFWKVGEGVNPPCQGGMFSDSLIRSAAPLKASMHTHDSSMVLYVLIWENKHFLLPVQAVSHFNTTPICPEGLGRDSGSWMPHHDPATQLFLKISSSCFQPRTAIDEPRTLKCDHIAPKT